MGGGQGVVRVGEQAESVFTLPLGHRQVALCFQQVTQPTG